MSGCARLSKSPRSVELGLIESLSNAMTHSVMVSTGFEMMVRDSLDSAKVADKIPAPVSFDRFAPFQTLTVADVESLLS